MKVMNQNHKYIDGKENIKKIMHMAHNGYGSIEINDRIVTYENTIKINDEDVIIVNVGGINERS